MGRGGAASPGATPTNNRGERAGLRAGGCQQGPGLLWRKAAGAGRALGVDRLPWAGGSGDHRPRPQASNEGARPSGSCQLSGCEADPRQSGLRGGTAPGGPGPAGGPPWGRGSASAAAWGWLRCWVGAGRSAVTSVPGTKGALRARGVSGLSATSKAEIAQKWQVFTKSLRRQCGGALGSREGRGAVSGRRRCL